MNPCLAIIDRNTLSSSALSGIIRESFGAVEIRRYRNLEEFIRDSNRHFVHFLVSSDILFRHINEFETLSNQTTALSEGPDKRLEAAGYNVLDISLSEEEIRAKLAILRFAGRYVEENSKKKLIQEKLSPREKDVLKLMVKGLINKEIAKQLKISTPTVIFHRNNICEKLQTRSLGKLTILAVVSGIIEINEF